MRTEILTSTCFVQGVSVVFRCTPLTVEPSSVVKTLEALACCGVTVTGGPGVCVVITVALATLAILFLCKTKNKTE